MATGLDVAGNIAFLGHRVYGVQAVDVSNPYRPTHISGVKTDESQSVVFENGLLFNGDWATGEIKIFDVSNPADMRQISTAFLEGFGDGLCVRDNLLFAATGHHLTNPEISLEDRFASGHGP